MGSIVQALIHVPSTVGPATPCSVTGAGIGSPDPLISALQAASEIKIPISNVILVIVTSSYLNNIIVVHEITVACEFIAKYNVKI